MRQPFWGALILVVILAGHSGARAQPAPPVERDTAPDALPVGPRTGTPEQLLAADVKRFFQDLNAITGEGTYQGDIQVYVSGAERGYFGASEWLHYWPKFTNRKVQLTDLKITTLEGDSATVAVSYTVGQMGGYRVTENLKMSYGSPAWMPEQKFWQFTPEVPEPTQKLASAPLVYAIDSLSQQPGSLERFRGQQSLRNLRQLAMGMMQFLPAWGNRYALSPEFAEEALAPYVGAQPVWTIPGTTEHYRFNGRLSRQDMTKFTDLIHTVLFYEGSDEKPLFHYDGKAAICFLDGHVELVDEKQFGAVRWSR